MIRHLASALLAIVSTSAFAAPVATVVTDPASGLPRCVKAPNGKGYRLLYWDQSEHYSRDVYTIAPIGLIGKGCEGWKDVAGWTKSHAIADGARKIEAGETTVTGLALPIGGIALSAETRDALAQARKGGNEYHKEATAEQWYAAHPFSGEYDLTLNKSLTQRFGMGFAGEIYRAYLNAQPANKWMKDKLFTEISKVEGSTAAKPYVMAEKPYVLMVGLGMGWSPEHHAADGYGAAELVDDLVAVGMKEYKAEADKAEKISSIRFHVFKNIPYGRTEDNVAMYKLQIVKQLAAGNDVMLFGGCKGVQEMMWAMAEVANENGFGSGSQSTRPAGWGKLRGVVSLSGLMGGSFVADWVGKGNLTSEHKKLLAFMGSKHLPFLNDIGKALTIAPSIETGHLLPAFADYQRYLPRDIAIVNAVGIQPGDGLMTGTSLAFLQNFFIRPFIKDAGANDGYIEYPLAQVSREVGPNNYAVVFDSTHMIVDGPLDGMRDGYNKSYQMKNADTRHNVLKALFGLTPRMTDHLSSLPKAKGY